MELTINEKRMAGKAIMQAVQHYRRSVVLGKIEDEKRKSGMKYNYLPAHNEREVARENCEILFCLFCGMGIELMNAVEKLSIRYDGICGSAMHYFDAYIQVLQEIQAPCKGKNGKRLDGLKREK